MTTTARLADGRLCRTRERGTTMAKRSCSIESCDAPVKGRGWCSKHYQRWKAHGDPLGGNRSPMGWPDNLLLRRELQPNGCVWFTGGINDNGYGRVRMFGVDVRAHRAAYELFVGPIPDGQDVDHLCHNADRTCVGVECLHRRCVEPTHLEAVTHQENCRRGHGGIVNGGRERAKTHCKNGHPFDEANTSWRPGGERSCRVCRRDATRRYRERMKATAVILTPTETSDDD